MAPTVDFDLRQAVLVNGPFGPNEVRQMAAAIEPTLKTARQSVRASVPKMAVSASIPTRDPGGPSARNLDPGGKLDLVLHRHLGRAGAGADRGALRLQHAHRRPTTSREIHFLIGADGDEYAGHAKVVSTTTGPAYDHAHPEASLGSDWALLVLDTKLGTPDRILPLRATPPAIGSAIMIGGYSEDRRYILTADTSCHVTRCRPRPTRRPSLAPQLHRHARRQRRAGAGRGCGALVDRRRRCRRANGRAIGYAVTLEEAKKHL